MTIKESVKKIQNKETSFTELMEYYIAKIKNKDTDIHSFLYVNEEAALREAKEADDNYSSDIHGSLFGVPYAVKDNILTDGIQATAASKILENYISSYDATVVLKIKGEGGIIIGKTNLDEFAMGSSTENSAFGPTKNPLDLSRVPGGSSGGSAAAVAAGLAPYALGTDTGGSIRQPAAFCGVVGFKPTYGAVSRHGLIAMASSLDQAGTLTQTVEDVKIIFPTIAGKDDMDATSGNIDEEGLKKDPSDLKIGVVKEFFGEGLDSRVEKKVRDAIDIYKNMGADIKEISLPNASLGLAVYYIIMPSEVSSNLARYDGVRYGMHQKENHPGGLWANYLKTRGDGFGEEAKRRIMLGTYTLSAGYYDAYYLKAQKVRALIEQDIDNAFKDVDVIISPTTPTLPFKFGEKTEDPLSMYLSDVYTVIANLVGLPAISIPVGNVKEDSVELSVGMQIMAPKKKDLMLLDVAELFEKEIN
ncbi:MAG: Asp-tRNA(Asn)/Glu-tRNA(Gln) amidotransferase subunit GatA [Candidatus Spechtbacterales bacterium]|nr:Asp-tRNA(Asn)/Glu-tRNA(Gln) amidotransferase subunit GatA [Candidatus Spechtbacterales bacterium]